MYADAVAQSRVQHRPAAADITEALRVDRSAAAWFVAGGAAMARAAVARCSQVVDLRFWKRT
eukprot:3622294-Prymnesium_polylepis.1